MAKKELIINGNNFSTLKNFCDEMEMVLTFNLNWKPRRNLDVFNDLLSGGFGVFDHNEPIKLTWLHFSKSKRRLGDEMVGELIDIIKNHEHIEFLTEE